jgi:hypothetical protein
MYYIRCVSFCVNIKKNGPSIFCNSNNKIKKNACKYIYLKYEILSDMYIEQRHVESNMCVKKHTHRTLQGYDIFGLLYKLTVPRS